MVANFDSIIAGSASFDQVVGRAGGLRYWDAFTDLANEISGSANLAESIELVTPAILHEQSVFIADTIEHEAIVANFAVVVIAASAQLIGRATCQVDSGNQSDQNKLHL